jgi:rfaE bifunctional protein nucleotidyltransferase chain/domain
VVRTPKLTRDKILQTKEIANLTHDAKQNGNKIVLCHGVFDVLHVGHLNYLKASKALGDLLVVSVTADEYVNKGPGRPIFSLAQRMEMLAALDVVDFVVKSAEPTSVGVIKDLTPDIYAKGPDYSDESTDLTGNIEREKLAVEEGSGTFVIIDEDTFSSSAIINELLSPHSSAVIEWVSAYKTTHSEYDIISVLEAIKGKKVLVLGDAIIDEYMYCEALGKASKDPVLAFREIALERQLGGVFAIARHCLGLEAEVVVGTKLGQESKRDDLLRHGIAGVELHVAWSAITPTVVKRRFVDQHSNARVFETYQIASDSEVWADSQDTGFLEELLQVSFDLVPDVLSKYDGLIAVNTQTNAGNRGFNTIGRYARADFVSLNGAELSLEMRRRHLSAEETVPSLFTQMGAQSVVVTEGAAGLFIYRGAAGAMRVPAFAPHVRDRVGAGDALFAITSLAQLVGADIQTTGLLGNLAGAEVVSQLGNQSPVSVSSLSRHALALLK